MLRKIGLLLTFATLPFLLMAATPGGLPARVRFQAIGVNQAPGALGTINGVSPSDWARLSQTASFTGSTAGNRISTVANSDAGTTSAVFFGVLNDASQALYLSQTSTGYTGSL